MSLYIYKLVSSEEEKSLCELEARVLLQQTPSWDGQASYIMSTANIDINRSVFLKWKIEVSIQAHTIEQLKESLQTLQPSCSYRLNWLEEMQQNNIIAISKQQKRQLEKELAAFIRGSVDLKQAKIQYAIVRIDECFYAGTFIETENKWQQHINKPRQYSTALSTRLARTIVNIAVPAPSHDITFVDPCCGIGTVILEAAALGLKVEGFDLNPVVLKGTRENIAYYHYDVNVKYANMLDLNTRYNVAVLDLPYNVCSVLGEDEKIAMIKHISHLAERFIIVSVEPIEEILSLLQIKVIDRAEHYKANFKRELFLCVNDNGILNKH